MIEKFRCFASFLKTCLAKAASLVDALNALLRFCDAANKLLS